MEQILSLCRASLESERGVTLFVGAHRIPMVVTEIGGDEVVKGRSQEYGEIAVLLSAVTAAAYG